MNAEQLRSYIARFREWLSGRAAEALGTQYAGLVTDWRQELDACERLLEEKAEIPIAFLGPSQQGKSSLINALLGYNVLAVGGAVGACTCVVTSVHYREEDEFRAEIDFIALDDWRQELRFIQQSLEDPGSPEDTDADREEQLAARKAAVEKFSAVYRRGPDSSLEEIIDAVDLGLPAEVVHAMSSGTPIVVREENPLTLRNKVRRYLVGREQHEDGQFWPLINQVRIYGQFPALANGVVLVDLPGLNDPNPAREQVTKRYLQEARYIWLVCNSQTGIDRVFTEMLRDNGLFFRLFLEGRLEAFSVVATRLDDINLEVVLGQMGIDVEEFDGNYRGPLEFRRRQVVEHVQKNLLAIAQDILSRADDLSPREAFLTRVRSIPVFCVSTAAFLHAVGRMPLYGGLKLEIGETGLPHLIEHLHSVTKELSHRAQLEAANRRVRSLREQVKRFFFDLVRRIEEDDEDARREWENLVRVAATAIQEGESKLATLSAASEDALAQRCRAFEDRLELFDREAGEELETIFKSWEVLHWRSIKAAVERNGEWFSRATGKEINFSRDVARAYLDRVPFVWDDFFGVELGTLIRHVVEQTEATLNGVADRIEGALHMLRRHPDGLRESIRATLRTVRESFELQAGQVRAAVTNEIQRTRQSLAAGMVATAASFMAPAYDHAQQESGAGVKRRMLDILMRHAKAKAPTLFVSMRKDLADGVTVLRAQLTRDLSKFVANGKRILAQFRHNVGTEVVATSGWAERLKTALQQLPDAPALES